MSMSMRVQAPMGAVYCVGHSPRISAPWRSPVSRYAASRTLNAGDVVGAARPHKGAEISESDGSEALLILFCLAREERRARDLVSQQLHYSYPLIAACSCLSDEVIHADPRGGQFVRCDFQIRTRVSYVD